MTAASEPHPRRRREDLEEPPSATLKIGLELLKVFGVGTIMLIGWFFMTHADVKDNADSNVKQDAEIKELRTQGQRTEVLLQEHTTMLSQIVKSQDELKSQVTALTMKVINGRTAP